jgi:hypothetical protein
MTIPGRVEAARLLLSFDPPVWFVRHAIAVAEVAGWLARQASARGIAVDQALVEAAGLLHDVDKLPSTGPLVRGLPHGEGSAAWLASFGAVELVDPVRQHPVTRLADDASARAMLHAPVEVRLVAYADKRAGQRLESMDARFASWRRRYPDGWDDATAEQVRARADALERGICEALGIRPDAVRRLPWAARAIRAARARPARAA